MISLIKTPAKYTPANNPVIFQIQSDNPNITFFYVNVADASGNTINNLRLYTSPSYQSGSYCDLSNILANTVDYQLLPSSNLVDTITKNYQSYQLVITEKIYNAVTGWIIDGVTLNTSLYSVFNGLIDRLSFASFNYSSYALTATGTTTHFLTNKPLINNIYKTANEYLYWLSDGQAGNVRLKFYGSGNILLGNQVIPFTSGNTCSRIDISPAAINSYFGLTLSNTYGKEFYSAFAGTFGDNYSINVANYFTVSLENSSGVTKSDIRTYVLKDVNCSYIPVQILFSNQLGGYDSITLFNPQQTIDVTNTSINLSPLKLNNSGIISDYNNNIFNKESTIINTTSVATYKVISDVLRDVDSIWLKELIKAQTIYILSNGFYYPITVTSLSYPVRLQKYATNLIRLELTFTVNDTGIQF